MAEPGEAVTTLALEALPQHQPLTVVENAPAVVMARPRRTVTVLAPFGKRVNGAAEFLCGLGRCGVECASEVAEKVAHLVVGVAS